ncbi:hypothetical protein ACAG25_23395 [Mycobacterium sp. pV006]|uniref:hypothetical protein n=1 Tax=Mycobacterium sp. pV006 TaxID=3238983 RepID=UPI00351B19CA
MRLAYLLAAPVLAAAGVIATPNVAQADCTSAGGTTLCSQGDSRGSNAGGGPSGSSGPYVPYPCEYDYYYCDDVYGWGINLDVDLDRPQVNPLPADRPNIGGGGGNRGGNRGGGRR